MTLDQIIKDLKLKTIDENNQEFFFNFVIESLRNETTKYRHYLREAEDVIDFYTNNETELKNILIFADRYNRMIEIRSGIMTHEEHGREFSFCKSRHFDNEIDKWVLNRKLNKIKC